MSEVGGIDAEERSAVLKEALSVGLATGAYGISFGALAVAAGLSIGQTVALSLLMFTGGSQFAFVGIIGTGGLAAAPAAIATSALLGIRNGLYALEMTQILRPGRLMRFGAAQLTIDESTAVGVSQSTRPAQRLGFYATGLAVFLFWNLMTALGAVVGNALGDPRRYGLDAAACAAFVALLWPRLKSRDAVAIAGLAVFIAILSSPFVPAGVPVLLAALASLLALWSPRRTAEPTSEVLS